MNKQEAIEQLEWNVVRTSDFDRAEDVVVFEKVKSVISQIHEPQKVVVPKVVATWIEHCKQSNLDLDHAMRYTRVNNAETGVEEWIYENQETFARAWLDGYEIEQLYTVEIAEAILTKITRGGNVQYKMLPFGNVSDVFDKAIYTTRLTDQEIKQKDERLWQFAKEVE